MSKSETSSHSLVDDLETRHEKLQADEPALIRDNPWRETVRNIFDELILRAPSGETTDRLLQIIYKRHHAYFCEGNTLAEWERIKNG